MVDQGNDSGHVILCEDCGMAAVVPFEPQPGRHIFCRACYRRRREEERRSGARREGRPSPRRGTRGGET